MKTRRTTRSQANAESAPQTEGQTEGQTEASESAYPWLEGELRNFYDIANRVEVAPSNKSQCARCLTAIPLNAFRIKFDNGRRFESNAHLECFYPWFKLIFRPGSPILLLNSEKDKQRFCAAVKKRDFICTKTIVGHMKLYKENLQLRKALLSESSTPEKTSEPPTKKRKLGQQPNTIMELNLPKDILQSIFRYLDGTSLLRAESVSKRWQTYASQESFWQDVVVKQTGKDSFPDRETQMLTWREYYQYLVFTTCDQCKTRRAPGAKYLPLVGQILCQVCERSHHILNKSLLTASFKLKEEQLNAFGVVGMWEGSAKRFAASDVAQVAELLKNGFKAI